MDRLGDPNFAHSETKSSVDESDVLYQVVKRALDIGGSLIGLMVTLLLYVPIAVAIKLDSPGPVIFTSDRAGRKERLFRVYKFRTMHVTSSPEGHKPVENDERVTRVGRFLRRTSLDELPQCYNVLRGDMSIVGPRPEQVVFLDAYQGVLRRRFDVKPGLTGWWQVNGRKQPMYTHAEEDVYYVEHQSLWLDLVILVRTVKAVIGGRGAV
jgi:lipopolysaccharide/colanic/teichoic acid biosynthesis glycosyltransferase